MEEQPAGPPDPCLLPFLHAKGEPEAQKHLEGLIKDAAPIILGILRRKGFTGAGKRAVRPGQDAETVEDLHGEVVARLLTRLSDLRAAPTAETIRSFRSFVATTTYHVYDDHLREKYPQRSSLKKQLAYLLTQRTNQHGFALWYSETGRRLCGFKAWQDRAPGTRRTGRYEQLLEEPHRFAANALPRDSIPHVNLADLLAALFNGVGGPIDFNDLVDVVAELRGVKDQPPPPKPPEEDGDGDWIEGVADPRGSVATEVEQRDYVRRLWAEIRELPSHQCAALLLNLRDARGFGVIELLELLGVATFREIAAALAIPAEQFAALLSRLPMDDATIARRLRCDRQQVINYRKSARKRLERHMQASEKSG